MQFLDGPDIETLVDRMTSSKSVIVSEAFGSKHSVGVGDVVQLPIGLGAEEFEVAAVYFDYSAEHGYVIGHREVLMNYLPDDRLTSLAVYLSPDTDLEAARVEVIGAIAGRRLRVARNRELREGATTIFDRTFAITYALEAVAVFVAILGMAGALLTLVIDRRAELGVLRAVGATKRQVRQLVLAQAGMLGLVSNVVGLVLGAFLSVILIKVINKQSFGWTIQFHWPVGLLVAAISIIFATSLIAGTYPARVAASRNPLDAMHEE
jgi:putative ABC transport system permease protein